MNPQRVYKRALASMIWHGRIGANDRCSGRWNIISVWHFSLAVTEDVVGGLGRRAGGLDNRAIVFADGRGPGMAEHPAGVGDESLSSSLDGRLSLRRRTCQSPLDSVPYFHETGNMESDIAIRRLSALAQESRLAVFRLLVRAGREGVPAGEIARVLDVPPNTLSAQLNILANASLVVSRREGRSIIYGADYDRMSELLVYLMEDCCQGRPEVRAPLAEAVAKAACCYQPQGALS